MSLHPCEKLKSHVCMATSFFSVHNSIIHNHYICLRIYYITTAVAETLLIKLGYRLTLLKLWYNKEPINDVERRLTPEFEHRCVS
jgi:hypothetical protein